MKISTKTLSLSLIVLLTACGGGGGPTTTVAPSAVTLTAANQDVAVQDAAAASFMPFVGAQQLTGVQLLDERALFGIAREQLDKFPVYMADANSSGSLVGVMQSQSFGCSSGGSLTVSVNDADNNQVLSSGDSMTITANNCVETSGVITGSMGIAMTTMSGTFTSASSTNYNLGATLTFANLSIASGQSSVSIDGSMSLSANKNGAYSLAESITTPSLTLSGIYAGVSRTLSLTNYSASATQTPDATYTSQTSYAINGTLTSTGLSSQAISMVTTTPFVLRGVDYYPSTGVMVINGGNNSRVRVTASDNTQVLLELDANGDGAYESGKPVSWTSLM